MSAAQPFEPLRERESVAQRMQTLRSHKLLVIGVIVACVLVAAVHHARAPKAYSATASVAFQSGTLTDSALQVSQGSSSEPQREADTEVLIAHSSEVAAGVRRQLHSSSSVGELLGQVKVEAAANANILEIGATSGDPLYSARLANAFASQYIAFRTRSELASIETAQSKLQRQIGALPAGSTERTSLEQSLQRIAELRAVAGGGANIIGQATPPSGPSGTSFKSAVSIGLLIGLALAFSLVFLLESLDRRIKTIEEMEQEYRLPALTAVTQSAFRSRSAKERNDELEPYRILRSALDFAAVARQIDTLVVTSAVAGEGKTTVSVDLAHAVALSGRPVVLMELDLRRPTFATHFELSSRDGLTTALARNVPVSELLVEPFPDLPNLSVLPAGRLPHNPSELLGSARVTDIIAELTGEDGTLIIDAPPLNPVADTQVLLGNPAIHAVLVVGRLEKTTRDEARRARAILDRHMVEPVGLAVTGLRDSSRYGYEAYGVAVQQEESPLDTLTPAGGVSRPAAGTGSRPAAGAGSRRAAGAGSRRRTKT